MKISENNSQLNVLVFLFINLFLNVHGKRCFSAELSFNLNDNFVRTRKQELKFEFRVYPDKNFL